MVTQTRHIPTTRWRLWEPSRSFRSPRRATRSRFWRRPARSSRMFPTAPSVPLNGEIEIVVTVIENGVAAAPPTTPARTPADADDTDAAYCYDERRGRNAGTKWHTGLVYDDDRTDRAERGENEQRSGAGPVHLHRSERDRDDHRVLRRGIREAGEPEGRQRGGRARPHQRDAADARPEWRHHDDLGAGRGCVRVRRSGRRGLSSLTDTALAVEFLRDDR